MIDKSKIILTDIDGVVLNWEYAFGEYMEFQGHQPVEGHNKFYSVRQKYNLPTDASGDLVIKISIDFTPRDKLNISEQSIAPCLINLFLSSIIFEE